MRTYLAIIISLLVIVSSCKKDKIEPLTASFTWKEVSSGTIELYGYANTGIPPGESEYIWEYGDGSIKQSNENNVSHTYKKNVSYNVTLTVHTKDGRTKKVTNTVEINSIPTNGQGSIYSTVSNTGGVTDAYVGGVFEGQITVYYKNENSNVICGETGNVTFTRSAGTYPFIAKAKNGKIWNGNITLTNGSCTKMKVTN